MQRREFLNLLGCSAALGVTGLPSLLPEQTRWVWDRLPYFIGLGNAGVNFVGSLREMVPPEYQDWPWIHTTLNRMDGKSAELVRPAFRRHLSAIIHGNYRGVYEQQAVHGRVQG
jgi:hypothetical protein